MFYFFGEKRRGRVNGERGWTWTLTSRQTKVFRSKDYNALLWVLNQLFTKVDATKPPSSRNVSAEIFVVCRGFKAPKRIDPRLLDPRSVFEDLAAPTPNNEAKVYQPEVKKRKREGYEEGDYLQFKEIAASEFIQTTDPIAILGQYNKLTFDQAKNGDVALAALDRLPETTEEIRLCCADLKVLGRKEFKLLLKWRLRVREIFGFPTKKTAKASLAEEVAVVENMDEELQIQEELQKIKDKESSKKKKERRKENEKKQKEIVRMQMNMTAPMDIGMEQEGPSGEGSMFRLKAIDETAAMRRIAKGKMTKVVDEARRDRDSGIGSSGETDDETDDDGDRLEQELDNMYDDYRERKAASDAKYRAKKARQEHGDDEWEGVSADEKEDSDDDEALEEDSSDDSDMEEGDTSKPLLRDLDNTPQDGTGMSKRARGFFSQDIFQSIPGLLDVPDEEESEGEAMDVDVVEEIEEESEDDIPTIEEQRKQRKEKKASSKSKENGGFEVVKQAKEDEEEDDWEETEKKAKKDGGRSTSISPQPTEQELTYPDIDIVTAEAMTLAHQLARGEKSAYDVIDEGYNKYAFKDRDGLPDWFLDDEGKHDRPHKPITKEAASAIKEKLRAYNARPIKKVAEARARKKFKQAQKLEKLKKKADLLAGDEVRPSSSLLIISLTLLLTNGTGHVRKGEGNQHRQADFCRRAQEAESACQGGQGPGPEPRPLRAAQGCQGPVQDGGPAHEEGNAGVEADCEEVESAGLIISKFMSFKMLTLYGDWNIHGLGDTYTAVFLGWLFYSCFSLFDTDLTNVLSG